MMRLALKCAFSAVEQATAFQNDSGVCDEQKPIGFSDRRFSHVYGLPHLFGARSGFAHLCRIRFTCPIQIEPVRVLKTKLPKLLRRRWVNRGIYVGKYALPRRVSGILARTLDANNRCGDEYPLWKAEELTTQPYYVSFYVFVFNKSRNYDIRSLIRRSSADQDRFENDTLSKMV